MTRYRTISSSLDVATNYFDEMNGRRKKARLDELRLPEPGQGEGQEEPTGDA